MNPRWFSRHDWPLDHELQMRTALMDAVRRIPGGAGLSEENIEGKALFLLSASNSGRDEEQPCNRPASRSASERELIKLHDLARKLADRIDALRRPSVAALWANDIRGEAQSIFGLATQLRELSDTARCAYGEVEASEPHRRARTKIEAAEVAGTAAFVFEHISGRRATFTTDPNTSAVSGEWPDFLGAVYVALRIPASVESQMRALREKTRSKSEVNLP